MSDHHIPSTADEVAVSSYQAAIDDYAKREAEFRTLQASALMKLKPILFGALKIAGIARVTVTFDGSGDSGQIESVEAYDIENNPVELPAETMTYPAAVMDARYEPCAENRSGKQFVGYDVREIEKTASISTIIEEIFWDFIGARHGGWENNDGGFGQCHFTVDEGVIRLEMNERYTETNYFEHQI